MNLLFRIDDAEKVSIRIFQNHEIVFRVVSLWMALGSKLQKSLDFARLVLSIEIKVKPVSTAEPFWNLI